MNKQLSLYILIFTITAATLALAYFDPDPRLLWQSEPQNSQSVQTKPKNIILTEHARAHILDGDERGGGHRHGTGRPCKSEFPKSWNDEEIIETIKSLAANDNIEWHQEDNGYYVTENMKDELKIRIVLGRAQQKIITAYPINVRRNPC